MCPSSRLITRSRRTTLHTTTAVAHPSQGPQHKWKMEFRDELNHVQGPAQKKKELGRMEERCLLVRRVRSKELETPRVPTIRVCSAGTRSGSSAGMAHVTPGPRAAPSETLAKHWGRIWTPIYILGCSYLPLASVHSLHRFALRIVGQACWLGLSADALFSEWPCLLVGKTTLPRLGGSRRRTMYR